MKVNAPLIGTARVSVRSVAALVLLATSSCFDSCDGGPVPYPVIERVEIIPIVAEVPEGKKFTLRVRVIGAGGRILPESRAASAKWTVESGLASPSPIIGSLTEISSATVQPLPLAAAVKVELFEHSDRIPFQIVGPPPTGGKDWIVAAETVASPLLAMVDGMRTTGFVRDTIISFVGNGPLDDFRKGEDLTNKGEVTVFSLAGRIARLITPWTDNQDRVSVLPASEMPATDIVLSSATDVVAHNLQPQQAIPIAFWNLDAPATADLIGMDLAYAQRRLDYAYAGLTITPAAALPEAGIPSDVILDVAANHDCPASGQTNNVRDQLEAAGVSGFTRARITVAYVRDTWEPPEAGIPSAYRGFSCSWNNVDGAIIVISASRRQHNTLAHELGHALGQRIHSLAPHFNESNLMWDLEPSDGLTREWLALGQSFRFSLDTGAFVQKSTLSIEPAVACPSDQGTQGNSCPAAAKDHRKP